MGSIFVKDFSIMSNIKDGDKLYIIVREDLSPGARLAQSVHAAFAYAREHQELTHLWMDNSNHICILEIENEEKLKELLQKAVNKNVKCSSFNESDMNDELTSIALEPSNKTRKLCYNLKLALK